MDWWGRRTVSVGAWTVVAVGWELKAGMTGKAGKIPKRMVYWVPVSRYALHQCNTVWEFGLERGQMGWAWRQSWVSLFRRHCPLVHRRWLWWKRRIRIFRLKLLVRLGRLQPLELLIRPSLLSFDRTAAHLKTIQSRLFEGPTHPSLSFAVVRAPASEPPPLMKPQRSL